MVNKPPRLPPRSDEPWDHQVQEALRAGGPAMKAEILPNGVRTMLHNPALAGRFLGHAGHLLTASALEPRWRELVILRTTWRTGFTYEWLWHLRMAPRVGIGTDEVDAVANGPSSERWTSLERALLAAVDQLVDGYCIEDDTWSTLSRDLDDAQMVEVPFVWEPTLVWPWHFEASASSWNPTSMRWSGQV